MSKLKSKIGKPQPLRVLMVEDSEDDVLLIIRELKKGGYDPVYERVETATAMKKALQEKQWDIVLCDYKLPKFNAISAIAVLKETNIDIPLLIVSGAIGEETAVECMRLGAHDYIMKNNLSRLCQAIARELEEADSRSKRKQAEEALRQSEERFRILFEQAADSILLLEILPEGIPVIRDANSATFRLLGYERDEIIGQPVSFMEVAPDAS
jgi:DNA-binding NtrC family response regulator